MRRRFACHLLAAFGLMGAVSAALGQELKGVVAYRVSVDGNLKITTDKGGSVVRRTQTEVDYRVARNKDGVDIGVDRFSIRALANGQEIDQVEISRSRLISRRAERPLDVRRDEAPPALVNLFAQFDPPLVTLKLDDEGGETERKAKENVGGLLLGTRMVELTRLFHPKFPKGESKWESPVVIPFGRGQEGNGVLRYAKKEGETKDGIVAVNVTGFLRVTGTHDVAEIKRGEYKVAGRQNYDTNTNEWVAGKLTVAIGWDAQMPNGVVLHANGPATFTFARRDLTAKAKTSRKKS